MIEGTLFRVGRVKEIPISAASGTCSFQFSTLQLHLSIFLNCDLFVTPSVGNSPLPLVMKNPVGLTCNRASD